MQLTLGFSPCPNDTFIFDALVNKKIDTEGLDFQARLEDVQTLNNLALTSSLNISKISYGVLPLLLKDYDLLNSGGALGKGVGPLLICKQSLSDLTSKIEDLQIAIPGENTTAHLLFTLAFPQARNKHFLVFNQIEEAVLNGEVDAGVIIHENRFTYHDKGLKKLIDLGEYWEKETNVPIPLGGIVLQKHLPFSLKQTIDRLIKKSVEFSFSTYPVLSEYITLHAQEMSEDVMRKHIDLYVNNYSLALAEEGKKAVQTLLDVYGKLHDLPPALLAQHIVAMG